MNDLTKNSEPIRDLTTDVATLHLELHELRQSVAALQATLPQHQPTVREGRRVTPKMLALLVAGVMLAGATIVFSQDAIGTTNPGTSKLKIANSSGDFAHFRFAAAGAGELEFVSWNNGWNINSLTSGKNLYLNRDTSSDVWIGPVGKEMIVKGDTGNVGIGMPPASNKLSVAGNANISGNVVAAHATFSGTVDVSRITRRQQAFSFAGVVNHGGSITVPWGTVNDWTIFVSPNFMGEEEPGSEGDNALLAIECSSVGFDGTHWIVTARYKYRHGNAQTYSSWRNGKANYILVPH